MKHKLFSLIVLFAMGVAPVFVACDDDEDDNSVKNLSDPRIRSMVIHPKTKIVVNDVEGIIFNYDSLDKGTNLSHVSTNLYGYVSQPTFKYKKDGEWVPFKNGTSLDLSEKLQILSTSEDNTQQKIYTIDIRVHNYDVSAFTWQEFATVDVTSRISSQKSFAHNGRNLWFCADEEGVSTLYSCTDLTSWEKMPLNIDNADWSSSAICGDSIYVMKRDGGIYSAHLDNLSFSLCSSVSIEKILFTIGDELWAIGADGFYVRRNGGDFQRRVALPEGFPSENITSFTSPSGYTSLGYIYASQNGQGTIWSMDKNGNTTQLQKADGTIPSLKHPNVFFYAGTLGVVGGEKEDGSYSTQCFSSKDGGVSWQHDWHKDLSEGISNSGTFIYSKYGEVVFVGGNTPTGFSNKAKRAVLNKLIADDLNYQN